MRLLAFSNGDPSVGYSGWEIGMSINIEDTTGFFQDKDEMMDFHKFMQDKVREYLEESSGDRVNVLSESEYGDLLLMDE